MTKVVAVSAVNLLGTSGGCKHLPLNHLGSSAQPCMPRKPASAFIWFKGAPAHRDLTMFVSCCKLMVP